MSRLNKNLQSKKKKRHMYMFTLSQKTKKETQLSGFTKFMPYIPPSLMCFKCCVVTKHTGGKWFCVMASESSSP